jgi:replication factor A1
MTLNMPLEKVIEKIVAGTNLSKEEVKKRIDEKVKELGGLITIEGAAHIIARELEINLYEEKQKQQLKPTTISELMPGMNNVVLTGMIKRFYSPAKFSRSDGTEGAVQNVLVVDKTGECRLVLWDSQISQFHDQGL